MKPWLLILVPLGSLLYLGARTWLRRDDTVSDAWKVDNQRRVWGTGIEQSCVRSWPLDKLTDEDGWWNARKHRTDA